MPTAVTSWKLEMELAGVGAGWTDVSADAQGGQDPLRFFYGLPGAGPLDRVATVGWATFSLNNGSNNSGGKLGYYSPLNTNCRSGFTWGIAVRISFTFGGTTYYKWRGKISEIDPVPGIKRERVTQVRCVDWMAEAADFNVRDVSAQLTQRGDQVFSAVLATMPKQPAATSIATSPDVFLYSLDDLGNHPKAGTVFQELAQSELSLVFVKGDTVQGGTLVYESRLTRKPGGVNNVNFAETDLLEMTVPTTLDQLYNRIVATAHPKTIDAAATTVLWTAAISTPINAGQTVTIWADFRNPNQQLSLIGGTGLVTPVSGTDFMMTSEPNGGTDLSANCTVTLTAFAATAKLVITNTGGTVGYMSLLQVRGKGIYDYSPPSLQSEDTAGQAAQGIREFDFDMPYQDDAEKAQEAAAYLLYLYGSSAPFVDRVRFFASGSSALLTQALAREISDKIGIDETVSGITKTIAASANERGFYIQSVEYEVQPSASGPLIWCTWGLGRADPVSYWILDDATYSVLGTTTKLGYF